MNIFLGTDICEIERIKLLHDKYGEKFLNKVFTKQEIEYCFSKKSGYASSLAVRFATKEAVSKALGVGLNGLGWGKGIDCLDVELVHDKNSNIGLKLYNNAKNIEGDKNIKNWAVSVSHGKDYAVSTVIGYK